MQIENFNLKNRENMKAIHKQKNVKTRQKLKIVKA